MSIIKILVFIWPFIKEMVLGDRSVRDAARDNKMKVLLAFVLAGSIGMNIFSVNRLWTLSQEYLGVKKEFAEYKIKQPVIKSVPLTPKPAETTRPDAAPSTVHETVPVRKASKKDKVKRVTPVARSQLPTSDEIDRFKKLQENFEKIKKREEDTRETASTH